MNKQPQVEYLDHSQVMKLAKSIIQNREITALLVADEIPSASRRIRMTPKEGIEIGKITQN